METAHQQVIDSMNAYQFYERKDRKEHIPTNMSCHKQMRLPSESHS